MFLVDLCKLTSRETLRDSNQSRPNTFVDESYFIAEKSTD